MITEQQLRELPPFRHTPILNIIPTGWLELLYDWGMEIAAMNKRYHCETRVIRVWVHNNRLTVREVTASKKPGLNTGVGAAMLAAEELETLSRSTCYQCGRTEGAKLRRPRKSDARFIMCADCAEQ
jgi:hypothetical protein